MAESQPSTSAQVKESGSGTQAIVIEENTEEPEKSEAAPTLHLRLHQPKNENKVKWSSDTIDNEFMGKKKSKCCCIYEKPKVFGESSSSSDEGGEDDGCTPHCRGHKKKCYRHGRKHDGHHHHDHRQDNGHDDAGGSTDGGGAQSKDAGMTSL